MDSSTTRTSHPDSSRSPACVMAATLTEEFAGIESLSLTTTVAASTTSPNSRHKSRSSTTTRNEKSTLPSSSWTVLPASLKAQQTHNPIRAIVDPIVASLKDIQEQHPDQPHISLALGDPSVYFPPSPHLIQSVVESAAASAGYIPAVGTDAARQAIAHHHHHANHHHTTTTTPNQVLVTNGCSGALELIFSSLLQPHQDILFIPQPGFPLYQVLCRAMSIQTVSYPLVYNKTTDCTTTPIGGVWNMDLIQLESMLQEYTPKAIVLNNPSNPVGAVFSKSHLQDFLNICERYKVVVIADEIYGDLTLDGHPFYPLADVAQEMAINHDTHNSPSPNNNKVLLPPEVPIVTVSGLGKQYLIPGWRVGWLIFHDNRHGTLQHVQQGAIQLASLIMGASHLAQLAVPVALTDPRVAQHKENFRCQLQEQAIFLTRALQNAKGLTLLGPPQGAMYVLAQWSSPTKHHPCDDVAFCQQLLQQENVLALPGECFGTPGVIRLVFCASIPVLEDAARRIVRFCDRLHS